MPRCVAGNVISLAAVILYLEINIDVMVLISWTAKKRPGHACLYGNGSQYAACMTEQNMIM